MNQKNLCTLEIQNIENTMLNKMQISVKEFNRQLKYLKQRVNETRSVDEQNQVTMSVYKYDYTNFKATTYYFTNCCCDVILTINTCKEGYKWTTLKAK